MKYPIKATKAALANSLYYALRAVILFLLAHPLLGDTVILGYLNLEQNFSALGGTVQAFTIYNSSGQDPDCLTVSGSACAQVDFLNPYLYISYLDGQSIVSNTTISLQSSILSGFSLTPTEWYIDPGFTILTAQFGANLDPVSFLTGDGIFVSQGTAQTVVYSFGSSPGLDPVFVPILTLSQDTPTIPEPSQLVPVCLIIGGTILHRRKSHQLATTARS